MRICAISDTHNQHNKVHIPKCDILIHAGDESFRGTKAEIEEFAKWFDKQNAEHLVWVPGNHSLVFQADLPYSVEWFKRHSPRANILINQAITIDNLKIWGSPATPYFMNWAWNYNRGSQIKAIWDTIPLDTDVLVTHGPPYRILDGVSPGTLREQHVGCQDLAERVLQVKPKFHIFGHIHECYGRQIFQDTTYINASIVDEYYAVSNDPVIIDL